MFDLAKYTDDFFKLPRPALQKRWVREYEAMATHIQGRIAKRLIEERRPYEDEEIKKYRVKNYEPITQGPFRRFNTDLSRVFSESQVTISTGNDKLQAFVDGPNFDGENLRSFWARRLCRRMIVDPNGYLVRWVDTVPDEPNKPVQPVLYMVLSKNVYHQTDDVFTWKANEKSMVSCPDPAGGRDRVDLPQGDVYYIVTKDSYFKNVQVGRVEDRTYDMRLHYKHNLQRMPVDVLGGDETSEENEKTNEDEYWFQSFIANAIPYANECARQWTDHQGVMVTAGFPLREMQPIACRHVLNGVMCNGGHIVSKAPDSDRTIKKKCPGCGGTGQVPPFGPYGTLQRPVISPLQSGGAASADQRPMVSFISPPVDILEYAGKVWQDYKTDLEKELNLLFVEEQQSGVAKEIDREPKVAKLDEIGAHLFKGLMRKTVQDFAQLMFITLEEGALNITLPATFTVRTEEDLTNELDKVTGKIASPIISKVNLDYVTKRFPGDRVFVKSMKVLSDYDTLFGINASEVSSMLSSFIIDSVMVRRHQLGYAAIRRLVITKGEKVLEAPDIFAQIDLMVEELMPAARVDAEKPEPEPSGGFGA